ncbi:acyltransferase family protein [Dyadobacter sp. CY323]|uniref:acyltransferase family protein n=1 Tax=Dyadobacter sp. CY323 TaxID=2907302 RepID=UPI001F457418|nr:acyltransferase family protein [Dyadobacter sp. CY323]MCE6992745.1 acyltransferase [Dyadobacter sp. CY323]
MTIKYRPEIDGLRAIAVVPVVLFHMGFNWIEGGYFGVDVFFVISGYLITSIIIKENHSSSFSFKNFWMRRVQRILPALLVMVIAVLIASYYIVYRPMLKTYSGDAISTVFSYANISALLKFGDYWGDAAESSPFLHAWSLSVEEQYYLFYPVLIFFLFRNRLPIVPVLTALAALSLVCFLFATKKYPTAGFYLLPFRAWEMAAGGLLAFSSVQTLPKPHLKLGKLLSVLGLLLIISSYFIFSGSSGIGVTALLPVIGSVLVIAFASDTNSVGRLLGSNSLVHIGKVSYSLYLWHWPVIVLGREFLYTLPKLPDFYDLFIALLMIVFTYLSYFLVEKKTRYRKSILQYVFVLLAVCLTISFVYKNLLPVSYVSSFNRTKFFGLIYDVTPTVEVSQGALAKRDGIIAPTRSSIFKGIHPEEGIIVGSEGLYPGIVVVGDSHGAMWGKVIDEIGEELGVKRAFYTHVGGNPFFKIPLSDKPEKAKGFSDQQRHLYEQSLLNNLAMWKPKLLIVSCKWSHKSNENISQLEGLLKFVDTHSITVVLLNQPPIVKQIGEKNSSQYLAYLGYKPRQGRQYLPSIENTDVVLQNDMINLIAKKYAHCAVLDVASLYQKDKNVLISYNNEIVYYDDDHLSYQGTVLAKDKLMAVIRQKVQ